jgi:hypothetical protein
LLASLCTEQGDLRLANIPPILKQFLTAKLALAQVNTAQVAMVFVAIKIAAR